MNFTFEWQTIINMLFLPNGPFSYSRYWTGTSVPARLMRGIFSNVNDINLLLMIFPRMSLHCKLVPVQYREYENGLLYRVKETDLLSRLIKVGLKETVKRFHVFLFSKQHMIGQILKNLKTTTKNSIISLQIGQVLQHV